MSNLMDCDHSDSIEIVDIDVGAWVEAARHNPDLYRDRQVTEIVLTAIGLAPSLRTTLVLKGGALMALAFKSKRVTADVDFTAEAEPADFDKLLVEELNALLPRVAIDLGYLDLICRVQTVEKKPRSDNFENANFPALAVHIASARRGSGEEKRLENGMAPRVLDVEITFRDQVYAFQELHLTDADVAVRAFTLHELIAEKLRALLQQPIRKRSRRQDVYDIALLAEARKMSAGDYMLIHQTLIEKCRTRGIVPDATSLSNPEVIRRAQNDWNSLKLEMSDLPPFEGRFKIVQALYVALPWE